MQAAEFDSLPHLTADLPGVGGTLKREPEDFVVDEVAAYEPSGEGEHLFLWIEKRDVSGEDLLRHVARRLAIPSSDVGMAGIKDRRAVTRQWLSVPARCESLVNEIETERIRVLRRARHANKLKSGHLLSNRFSIRLGDVVKDAADRAERIAEVIGRLGFPNYFGAQRFGRNQETLRLGLDLIRGKVSPRSIPAARRRFLLRLALSAVQSALFNAVLAARIREGWLHTVLAGDVMQVVATGGPFVADNPAAEQKRFDAREIVVTGPMFGPKMRMPRGVAAEREQSVLAEWNLSPDDFARIPKLTAGARRPLVAWPRALCVHAQESALQIEFELDSGCYATSLLREFMKNSASDA